MQYNINQLTKHCINLTSTCEKKSQELIDSMNYVLDKLNKHFVKCSEYGPCGSSYPYPSIISKDNNEMLLSANKA